MDEWTKLGNAEDTLQFSNDVRRFRCLVCYDEEEEEADWLLLRGASDIRRHCIGGTSSVKNDKTPKMSLHARRAKELEDEEEQVLPARESRKRSRGATEKKKKKKKKNKQGKREKSSVEHEQDEEEVEVEESLVKPKPLRESREYSREQRRGKTPPEPKSSLPKALPKLVARVDGDPVQYECQWGQRRQKALHSIASLVEHYGDSIVKRVNTFDSLHDVAFVAERIVDKRSGHFLVHWRGYPDEFETWERADEECWEAGDKDGEHKRQLIEEFEG